MICETHRIASSQLKLNCLIPKSNEIQEASRRFVCCLQTEEKQKPPKVIPVITVGFNANQIFHINQSVVVIIKRVKILPRGNCYSLCDSQSIIM